MASQPADNLLDVWKTAVERLNTTGVFADESRQLADLQNLDSFEADVRRQGYTGGPLKIADLSKTKNGVNYIIFDNTKNTSPDSAILVWEGDYNSRWKETVTRRVADWLRRLSDLQFTIQGWLPENMGIVQLHPIRMHEELMVKFGVPPASMPSFDICKGKSRVMRVQPKGLWIIGANGRVDLITPTTSYIVVDKSRPGNDQSDWHFYNVSSKRQSTLLIKESFVNLLK